MAVCSCPVCGRLVNVYNHPDNGWELYGHRDRRGFPPDTPAAKMPWCAGRKTTGKPPPTLAQ